MNLTIITPEKKLVDAEVLSVSIPTSSGIITVLPHHQPLISKLAPGELTYRTKAGSDTLLISGGMLEVAAGSQVRILADSGERTDEISIERATEAMARAKKILATPKITEVEYAATLAALERSTARIRVARKHAGRKSNPITNDAVFDE